MAVSFFSCIASDKHTKPSLPEVVTEMYALKNGTWQNGTLVRARTLYQDGKIIYETAEFKVKQVGDVVTSRAEYARVSMLKAQQGSQ